MKLVLSWLPNQRLHRKLQISLINSHTKVLASCSREHLAAFKNELLQPYIPGVKANSIFEKSVIDKSQYPFMILKKKPLETGI